MYLSHEGTGLPTLGKRCSRRMKSCHFSDSGFTHVDVHESLFPKTVDAGNAGTSSSLLTRRKLASIDNLVCFLHMRVLVGSIERRARQSHKTSPCRFQNAEGSDELEERVDSRGLGRAVSISLADIACADVDDRSSAYISTMQLFVLMSNTLPPNWWVKYVMLFRCSCLCLRA